MVKLLYQALEIPFFLSFLLVGIEGLSEEDQDLLLFYHYAYRASVKPPSSNMKLIQWSYHLQTLAEAWAQKCTFSRPNISKPEEREIALKGVNVASVSTIVFNEFDYTPPNVGVQFALWLEGKENFRLDELPGRKSHLQHYRQLIWADTEYIGCERHICDGPPGRHVLVCVYDPAGNDPERPPYETFEHLGEFPPDPPPWVPHISKLNAGLGDNLTITWATCLILFSATTLGHGEPSTMECYTQGGPPYNGTLNHTAAGEPCLPWSEFTHLHLRSSWNASVLAEQSNYCRNPDDDPRGPWCMVTRAKYGTCAVPHCEHLIDCYEGVGEDYLGDASSTENDQLCVPWAEVIRASVLKPGSPHLVIINYTSPTNRTPVSSYDSSVAGFRSCRNPGGQMAKPWCYVSAASHSSNPLNPYIANVGYRKAPCKIDMCDQSSHMGLPLDFGDECPAGFMTQVGKTTSPQGEISTVYCVLSATGLRKTEKGRFRSYCMFLLNQNRETCPKGFDMKRTFMRTKLKAKGKFSMFRQEGFTSIWISLCCTNGSHAELRIKYPRSSVAYKSTSPRANSGAPWFRGDPYPDAPPVNPIMINDVPDQPVSRDTPIFVSIERCPPVNGTRRKIFTMGTYRPSNLTATLLDYGYYTSMCIYYEDNEVPPPVTSPKRTNETLVPSILVEGKTCPPHFSPAPNAKIHHMFYYLRAAFILCKPEGIYRHDTIDKILPDGNQCFISHTVEEVRRAENEMEKGLGALAEAVAADGDYDSDEVTELRAQKYHCPAGFDLSELRWSGGNASSSGFESINMYFCCRQNANSVKLASTASAASSPEKSETSGSKTATYPLPFYLRTVPTFAILVLGESCPDYTDRGNKLTADFRPTMQTESYTTLELIGQNNPVDFVESMSGVRGVLALCKYSQPRDEIGILAPQGFCQGVGERRVPTVHYMHDAGTTCAVNVTDVVFPPGSYCFYRTAKVCPPGLPELQTSVFEGLVRSFLLQTMSLPTTALNDEKELCCQSEESLGAIEMPLNITAPFALPALQATCQSFVGFTVDQTKGFCEYTPITEAPESIMVWPRRVFPSNLRGKTEIVLTCADNWALNSVSRARNFMMRHRRLWLIPTPMQDFSSSDAMELCYNEVRGSEVPTRTDNGYLDYCVVAFAVCPNEDFEMVSAFPYQQYIVCCVKEYPSHEEASSGENFQRVSTWPEQVRSIVTLGRKRPGDEDKVKDLPGPTELHRDLKQPETDEGCPEFEQFSLIRRFVKMWRPKRYKTLIARPSIHHLLNVSASINDSKEAFAKRTGLWLQDGLLHAIFCEYQTNRPAEANTGVSWPMDNYAIPQPVTGCPPDFTSTTFVHLQGRNGFHYSQPIHLAGYFIAHSRAAKLSYCHKETDPSPSHWNKRHTTSLPPGHYCVLLVGRRCPAGFTAGSLSVFEGLYKLNETEGEVEPTSVNLSDLPTGADATRNTPRIFRDKVEKGDTGLTFDRVTYMFCCRADSPSASIPITGFPNDTGPFYLYRAGETCQEIAGLRATEEYICMDAPEFLVGTAHSYALHMEVVDKTYHIEGFTPTLSMSTDHCNVKINLCYYESATPEPEPEPEIEHNNETAWPAGSYSLLTTIREDGSLACPPGFNLALRYNIRPDVIANTFFRPMSFSEYFTQKPTAAEEVFAIGNETLTPTLHTCERNASDVPEAYNLTSFPDWPPGNYCVLMDLHTRTCPKGLHRFTRQLAELCCHIATTNPTTPVHLPFIGDFFLMGAFDEPDLTCLPIENTHVEKYVVLLFSAVDPHIHSLCHYLPLEWLKTRRSWPPGDYLLPIGNRGQSIPTMHQEAVKKKFSCPAGFHRQLHEYATYDEDFEAEDSTRGGGAGSGELAPSSTVMLHFCQRNAISEEEAKKSKGDVTWPKGDYCVIVNGAICPPEMRASNELVMRVPRSYLRAIHNATDYGEIIEGQSVSIPSDSRSVTYYSVCCRQDKQLLVDLPTFSGGMYLPAGSSLCSSIPGTFIEHEHVTTYLDPTLLDPYMGGDSADTSLDDLEPSQKRQHFRQQRQRWMPPPFEEPGVMTLCYYHQMQKISTSNSSSSPSKSPNEDVDMLHELLEPGSTALSLWLAGECGCAENAICRPFKRFSCKCKKGHFGDGVRVCRPVTPLTDACANLCHEHAECRTRRKHSFISRTEETACVCNPGFVGDGFNCLPQCSAHKCQPFSRCKIRRGVPTCVCVPGTIGDGEKCHFDVYSSLQAEKDLPQYMLQHLSCFTDDVFKSLVLQQPKRFFLLFSPPQLLKNCDEIASHIAMLSSEAEYKAFIESPTYQTHSLNGSLIIVNNTATLQVNDVEVSEKPILFTNGRLYYTSAPLKYIPAQSTMAVSHTAIAVSLVLILLIVVIVGLFFLRRARPDLPIFNIRRPRFRRMENVQQASWRGSKGVLLASEEADE